ncbi:hypothetical protein AWH61_05090 [Alteromonas sp. W12]|uniref:lipopolysaccharide biosynthesis protein n=1 Tax=Alteromonas sp. W12 TaxID=1772289 RepID=UPI0009490E16|nr:hypothetical protein [Alteromonas sp. W12]OLF79223.1 hypothetical protein AWH61_05090 [Alteromonas sp. W12]
MLKVLVTGALYNLLNVIVQILLGLIVFREMLLHFGEADFGTWSLLFAILAHVKLFEFGLGSIVSKLVPVLRNGDSKNVSYFSTAIVVMALIFTVFFFALVAVAVSVEHDSLKFEGTEAFTLVLLLIGCNFLFLYLTGVFHAYLTGSFQVGRLNSVRLFINILRSVLVIGSLQFDSSVVVVAFIFAMTSLLELLLLFLLSVKSGLLEDLDISMCSMRSFAYVAERGCKLFFLSVNDYVRQNALIIVSGFVLGVVAIVPLRIAGRLMEVYVQASISLNYLLTPYFSSISNETSDSIISKFFISIICATTLSAVIFFNIILVGDWFLITWLGEVPQFTSEVVKLVAIGFCVATVQGPCVSFLISNDKNKTLMVLCLLEIITLLAIIYPLVEYFGVLGAGYAMTISLVFSRGLFQPFIMSKVIKVRLYYYYANLLVPVLITGTALCSLYWLSSKIDVADKNINVAIFVLMQGGLALVVFYCLKQKYGTKRGSVLRKGS